MDTFYELFLSGVQAVARGMKERKNAEKTVNTAIQKYDKVLKGATKRSKTHGCAPDTNMLSSCISKNFTNGDKSSDRVRSVTHIIILPPYMRRKRKKSIFAKESFADPNEDPEVIHASEQLQKSHEVVQPTLKFNRSCCVCAPTRSLPHRHSTPYTKTSRVKPSSCTKSGFDF